MILDHGVEGGLFGVGDVMSEGSQVIPRFGDINNFGFKYVILY